MKSASYAALHPSIDPKAPAFFDPEFSAEMMKTTAELALTVADIRRMKESLAGTQIHPDCLGNYSLEEHDSGCIEISD